MLNIVKTDMLNQNLLQQTLRNCENEATYNMFYKSMLRIVYRLRHVFLYEKIKVKIPAMILIKIN